MYPNFPDLGMPPVPQIIVMSYSTPELRPQNPKRLAQEVFNIKICITPPLPPLVHITQRKMLI